jgi:hypothetical protein
VCHERDVWSDLGLTQSKQAVNEILKREFLRRNPMNENTALLNELNQITEIDELEQKNAPSGQWNPIEV